MKNLKVSLCFAALLCIGSLNAQNIQLHYDARHTVDPGINSKNFFSISFEYFKQLDSLGSFLFKMQSDLKGPSGNIGQTFIQLSQNLKFWDPKVYLSLNYSGGLGVAPPSFGFYLVNSFGVGISHPFQWNGAWLSLNTQYRYTAYEDPSHDVQVTFYFGKGFFNYRIFVNGSIVAWTENRNHGNEYTADLSGKMFAFFGDPQIWFKVKGKFSVGSRINLFYNLIGKEGQLKVYPTLGTQIKFQ